jgi:hypothetical protein
MMPKSKPIPIPPSKEELEYRKLKAETIEAEKKPYKRVSFWVPILTTVLTAASVITLALNGAFDNKNAYLANQKTLLDLQIQQNLQKNATLQATIEGFPEERNKLLAQISVLRNDSITLERAKEKYAKSRSQIQDSLLRLIKKDMSVRHQNDSLYRKADSILHSIDSILHRGNSPSRK